MHAEILVKMGVKKVYLALDSDDAGKAAARKVGDFFQRKGIEALVVALPRGMDPDSLMIEQGPQAFQDCLDHPLEYLAFVTEFLSEKIPVNTPAGKNQIIQDVVAQIRGWDNRIMEFESMKKLASLMKVPESLIGMPSLPSGNAYITSVAQLGSIEVNPIQILESDLLRWILVMGNADMNYYEAVVSNLDVCDFRSESCRAIFKAYQVVIATGEKPGILNLTLQLEDQETHKLLHKLFSKKMNLNKGPSQLMQTIKQILERNWMEKREQIKMKIHSGECSDDEALRLVRDFDALKAEKPESRTPKAWEEMAL